jgi:paraquat-inducible protein B
MSIRANPAAIGGFMVGALVLTLLGVGVLASTAWFGDRHTFISYFAESVNGLDQGAPVKFQGVPVGTVTEILIQIDRREKTFLVPVQYEIDLRRLTTVVGDFLHLDEEAVLQGQIADGLRAQLQMESLVTGQLYIELTYRPDAGPPEFQPNAALAQIPTTPSLLAAFGTEAGSLIASVLQVLFRVNELLDELDMRSISEAVQASAESIERVMGSAELTRAVEGIPEMTNQVARTLGEMERLVTRMGETIDPLQGRLETTFDEATLTLQAARQAIEATRGMLSTDSGIGYSLEQALVSLREAAEALRTLALSLERSPDMLIRGPRPPGR